MSRLVEDACTAKDWVEAGEASSIAEAVQDVVTSNGGNHTWRARVEGLATDLRKADSTAEVAQNLAAFAVCEAVGTGE